MPDDLFTQPSDNLNFGNDPGVDPGFNIGNQSPMMPMLPQDPGQLYTPMVPFNPQDPSFQIPGVSDGSGGWGAALAKILGFGGGGATGDTRGLMTLLSLLGVGGAAYLNHNSSQQAAADISKSVTGANAAATNVFSQQGALYKPYYDAGVSAVNRMAGQAPSNLAGNFNPLGTGRGIKLGTLTGH